jgi:hypothetical protein
MNPLLLGGIGFVSSVASQNLTQGGDFDDFFSADLNIINLRLWCIGGSEAF